MALPIDSKSGFLRWPPSRRWVSDRKSTRLNSSHGYISYAVFCLKIIRSLKRYAGERGPESSVFAFHHHHAAAPAVKLLAVVFPERAYVAAVWVVEKEAVSVVDHA